MNKNGEDIYKEALEFHSDMQENERDRIALERVLNQKYKDLTFAMVTDCINTIKSIPELIEKTQKKEELKKISEVRKNNQIKRLNELLALEKEWLSTKGIDYLCYLGYEFDFDSFRLWIQNGCLKSFKFSL